MVALAPEMEWYVTIRVDDAYLFDDFSQKHREYGVYYQKFFWWDVF